MANAYQSAVLALNPTIYMPMDDAAGVVAADISGNGYNGALHGGYIRGLPLPTGSKTRSTFFDGSTGYLSNGARFTTQHILTLVFWAFIVLYDSTQRWVMTIGDPNAGGRSPYWKIDTGGAVQRIGLSQGNSATYEEQQIARAPDSVWSMFSCVFDTQAPTTPAQITPYMQGNLVTKTVVLANAIGGTWQNADWYMMANAFGNNFFVGGYLADVALWSGVALTPAQIASLNVAGGGAGGGPATLTNQVLAATTLDLIYAAVHRVFPTT